MINKALKYKKFNELIHIEKVEDNFLKDLIAKLLESEPTIRINWNDYFNHEFFDENVEISKIMKINNINQIKNFKNEKQITFRDKKIDSKFLREFLSFQLQNLIYLNLNNNLIDVLFSFENLQNLKVLKLSGNKISNLDNNFIESNFMCLQILDLSSNLIEKIDSLANLNCPELIELYLSNNKILKIDNLTKIKFQKIKKIYLNDNLFKIEECEKVIKDMLKKGIELDIFQEFLILNDLD